KVLAVSQAIAATEPSWIPGPHGTQSVLRGTLHDLGCLLQRASDLLLSNGRAARCLKTSLLKTRVFDAWPVTPRGFAGSPAGIPCPTCDLLRLKPKLRRLIGRPLCVPLDRASVQV